MDLIKKDKNKKDNLQEKTAEHNTNEDGKEYPLYKWNNTCKCFGKAVHELAQCWGKKKPKEEWALNEAEESHA